MPATNAIALDAISNLDLSLVRMKLMLPGPEGEGWSPGQTAIAERWYKRFLHLHLLHPNQKIVPNDPIDKFWHHHILDTRSYAEACDKIFGSFLHHYPYFGLNGDEAARDLAFDKTNQLYRMEFGEDCTEMFHGDPSAVRASAGVDCSSPCATDEG